MSDIKQLLDRTARSAEAPPSAETVEADVLRGRVALGRRRRGRAVRFSVGGTLAAAALVGTAVVVGNPGGGDRLATPTPSPHAGVESGPGQVSSVRLVAYNGEQPDGFFVELVPEGWYIQDPDHPQYSLTIAPEGDTSHPDGFGGKLVVFLLSSSVPQELPPGEPVEVGDYDGVVNRDGGSGGATLTYQDDAGHYVQVQSPEALGWTNEQLASFAEGVMATADAKAGVG